MKFDKFVWFVNRLKAMGPMEILYRLRNEGRAYLESVGFLTASKIPYTDLNSDGKIWLPMNGLKSVQQVIISSADLVLYEGMSFFALDEKFPCITPEWNTDPLTGVTCPLIFGKKLDFKNQSLCGDVKYLWEISRFLQIVPLSRAWHVTGDEKYIKSVHLMVESWLDQCPYMLGVNWSSSLEIGVRLINWSIAWQYIGGINSPLFEGVEGQKFRTRWLDSIFQHIHFIDAWYSKGSSANNHLIGEAAGVFAACTTWPFWKNCKKWKSRALKILEHEADNQVFSDGVDREQAISYQQFVIDFFMVSYLADKKSFSESYINTIEKMVSFIASMMNGTGQLPMIGDADDGNVTGLGLYSEFDTYESILATAGYLFSRDDFLSRSGKYDLKTVCLTGVDSNAVLPCISAENIPLKRSFENGGYYILGDNFSSKSELFIVVYSGPLGYGTLAAHGHADALSIYLTYKNREFLIDPGTYVYNGKPAWRKYFRGTAAHNTVRIDRCDQSEQGGDFLWKTHARSEGEIHFDQGIETFRGRHNGYERLKDSVTHERVVSLNKAGQQIVVQDHIHCKEAHFVETFWHFSEKCEVVFDGPHRIIASNNGVKLELHFGESAAVRIVCGDSEIPSGWVSRSFGVKVPSVTVVSEVQIGGDSSLITKILYSE
ncbi:alginate lyase family protein [Desulfovibrio gilichinskyi]|uniref:Heparinase II/III N-terminus n=1 Tax=Desulfovibrio gilichinskyi TaxID=1519643 RepID=A0A1X7C5V2_9BACT|nr:alginate lyase family protein [Desulfovibrio gilichinskyi]SME90560.1 Heparinase II/III N-terminus [Desulfovibrio gilichinskyi]